MSIRKSTIIFLNWTQTRHGTLCLGGVHTQNAVGKKYAFGGGRQCTTQDLRHDAACCSPLAAFDRSPSTVALLPRAPAARAALERLALPFARRLLRVSCDDDDRAEAAESLLVLVAATDSCTISSYAAEDSSADASWPTVSTSCVLIIIISKQINP